MGDVVRLHEKLIWVCGHCNCTTFRLYNDSTIECALCGNESDDSDGWVESLKHKPVLEGETDEGKWSITNIGTVEFARKHTMKLINDWDADDSLALIMAADRGGSTKSWCNVETQAQKEWVIRKVEDYLESLKKTAVSDATE